MHWQDYIERDPDVMLGRPVFKGTRITVEFVLDRLGQGARPEELISSYAGMTPEHVMAAHAFAAAMLREHKGVLVPRFGLEIGEWFRNSREAYRWPLSADRRASERRIGTLCSAAQMATSQEEGDLLSPAMVDIHRWKTGDQHALTSKYQSTLEGLGACYLARLMGLGPFVATQNLRQVIKHLKVPNCNLPVCTAIASFLYGRRDVPVLDRFLSQFFTREFDSESIDAGTEKVLLFANKLPFKLEDGGNGQARLAVYTRQGFDYNLGVYIDAFLPECCRIAEELVASGVRYTDTQGELMEFLPVDVEMAIFAWCSQHSDLFDLPDCPTKAVRRRTRGHGAGSVGEPQ